MEWKDFVFFVVLSIISPLLYGIGLCVYNLYLHPLRLYSGPFAARASRLYFIYWDLRGESHLKIKELHDRYGEVVRIAPNELSYNSSQAWQDICGHRQATKHGSFEKDVTFFSRPFNGAQSIQTANDVDHRRMRRLQAHAFSEKALSCQEPIVKHYVDLLTSQLHKQAEGPNGGVVDMARWYNFTTFDLIGDLALGEPFGCLRDGVLHPWIEMIFVMIKSHTFLRNARRFPSPLKELFRKFIPQNLIQGREDQFQFSAQRAKKRMNEGTDREDFMSYILRANDEKGMTLEEIESNVQFLIVAGSETTATLLSGATFYLLKNPAILQQLKDEIRTTFSNEHDINLLSLMHLPYLNAVLEESLRMYPPVPTTFPRTTPAGGEILCGRFVPGGTSVGVHQWSTLRSERNFREPDSFIPERWLNDPRFDTDDKKAFQPFSYGPRNCLGKNLAYAEMRLILAQVLWNFDLELQPDSYNWHSHQKTFSLWEKGDLKVKLMPIVR